MTIFLNVIVTCASAGLDIFLVDRDKDIFKVFGLFLKQGDDQGFFIWVGK